MPRVNVKDTKIHERCFSDKSGKPQIFREQRAAIDLGDGYELPFLVGIGTSAPHPMGAYDISPECFTLNKYGSLELGRIKLVPESLVKPGVANPPPVRG